MQQELTAQSGVRGRLSHQTTPTRMLSWYCAWCESKWELQQTVGVGLVDCELVAWMLGRVEEMLRVFAESTTTLHKDANTTINQQGRRRTYNSRNATQGNQLDI